MFHGERREIKLCFYLPVLRSDPRGFPDSPLSSCQAICNTCLIMCLCLLLIGKAQVLRKLSGEKMLIWIYKFLGVFFLLFKKILPDTLLQLQHLPTWISLIPNINSD